MTLQTTTPPPLTLPGLALKLTTLPGRSGIRLWLLDEATADRPLEPALAKRLADEAPFWAICWAAGSVLAEHFLARPELVRGKTVLDFGAGSGVVAIAAKLAGAARVCAVDNDPRALAAARANAAANGVELDYFGALERAPARVDWVTAADLFYDPANLGLLEPLRTRGPLLVGEARCQTLDRHGLRKAAVVHAGTVPAFHDPQFETVTVWTE